MQGIELEVDGGGLRGREGGREGSVREEEVGTEKSEEENSEVGYWVLHSAHA